MIPAGPMLREFDRLYKEAKKVALNRDELLQFVFDSAVKLSSGGWSSPEVAKK